MEITGFVGKSGTGKSHQALNVARKRGCDSIIDDGLFLCGGKKLAGRSAKAEKTSIGAVKRAIFHHAEHATEVKRALREQPPSHLLILGTSREMIRQICENLDLPEVSHWIGIEEVATGSEIMTAMRVRKEEGRHVVPLPAPEIREDFRGYLLDVFLPMFQRTKRSRAPEKTIVRPVFSSLGNFTIHQRVLVDLIRHLCADLPIIASVRSVRLEKTAQRTLLRVQLKLALSKERNIREDLLPFQEKILDEFSFYLGIIVDEVRLELSQ